VKARKRSAEASVEVDGHSLIWTLEREAQWTTNDGGKGMAFSVRLADGNFRELLLEFPYPRWKPGGRQDKERIQPQRIVSAIRQAIDAGWDPQSRGRVFALQVPE
jgi:hypothetical protein